MNPHQVSVEAQPPQVTVTQSPVEVVVASRPVASVEITQAEPSITLAPEQISLTVSNPSIELTCQPTSFRSELIVLEPTPLIEVRPAPLPELSITLPEQGPPGPQGLQGPAGGQFVVVAGQTLSGHRVIALDVDGLAVYADNTTPLALSAVGFSSGAVVLGEALSIVASGSLEYPPADLIPDQPVFLSTEGFVTQTPPQTHWLRAIGVAVAPGLLSVDIGPAYWLGES